MYSSPTHNHITAKKAAARPSRQTRCMRLKLIPVLAELSDSLFGTAQRRPQTARLARKLGVVNKARDLRGPTVASSGSTRIGSCKLGMADKAGNLYDYNRPQARPHDRSASWSFSLLLSLTSKAQPEASGTALCLSGRVGWAARTVGTVP